MAQNQRRMVYTKIWTSQQFGTLSLKARLLYIGMITLADDDGRLVGSSSYLRGQIFPYEDIEIKEVDSLKKEVLNSGLAECYMMGMFEYIQHPNWEEYQSIRADLYKPSTLPDRNGNVTKPLRERNETVTKPLRKSSLSKDKISKDKIRDTGKRAERVDEDVVKIIDAFQEVNSAYKKWFANKTQRAAAKSLADTHGVVQVLQVIHILPKTNEMPYIPSITTPLQLEEKWAALESGMKRKKVEAQEKKDKNKIAFS